MKRETEMKDRRNRDEGMKGETDGQSEINEMHLRRKGTPAGISKEKLCRLYLCPHCH